MAGKYLIIFFLSVFWICFGDDLNEFYAGEYNGKKYNIKIVNNQKLQLFEAGQDKTTPKDIPICDLKNAIIPPKHVKIRNDFLFVHLKTLDGKEQRLQVIDLPSYSDKSPTEFCHNVNDVYFGEHKIHAYEVDKNNILKAWLAISDKKEIDVRNIATLENDIVSINAVPGKVNVTTKRGSGWAYKSYLDPLQCDTPGDDTCAVNTTRTRSFFEENVIIIIIITGVLIVILVLVCTICFPYSYVSKLNLSRKSSIYDEVSMEHEYVESCVVPPIPLSSALPMQKSFRDQVGV